MRETFQVAVLDLDYHLGDGMLDFVSEQCVYFSLHIDSLTSYPYWRPAGDLPWATLHAFPPETGAAEYHDCLARWIARIDREKYDAVVVLIGFDIPAADFIQDGCLNLSLNDLPGLARLLAGLDAPRLFLIEGGYEPDLLPAAAREFFAALT